jgi:hypothetical protein
VFTILKYVGFSVNHEFYYENLLFTCHSWYTANNNYSKNVSESPTAMSFVISVVATSIAAVSSVVAMAKAISVMAAYEVTASVVTVVVASYVVAVSVATSVVAASVVPASVATSVMAVATLLSFLSFSSLTSGQQLKLSHHHYKYEDPRFCVCF